MPDTNISLAPNLAHVSGAATVTASAALFVATDVGRLIGILHKSDTMRAASTLYTAGRVFISEYNQVPRLYRVIFAGTTAAALMAGTTPNYDLNAPNETGTTVMDGTAVLKYLGPGRHVWGWSTITGFTNATLVSVTIHPRGPFAATSTSLRWRMGEFSNARGWPIAGTFYKNRLWVFGSTTRPQTLWASESGDFESFAPTEPDGTVLDTNAISYSIDDDQVNTARWLMPSPRGLAAGVASGEFLISPANKNGALSPSNISADRQGDRGSDSTATPQRAGGTILFPQRGGKKLRQLEYDFSVDRFTSPDLTALADHITGGGFIETAYTDLPNGLFYGLRPDGKITVLTFDPDQKLRAYTVFEIAGGTVESIAVVPDPTGSSSDLYMAVARTLAGVTTRRMEWMRAPFDGEAEAANAAFIVDAGLTYSGVAVNTVAGLAHLEGRTVAIVADGSVRQPQLVTGGIVTITGPASILIHVGLAYRARILTMEPEAGARPGNTSQGSNKRAVHTILRLLYSGGGSVSGLGMPAEALAYRRHADAMGLAVPLFSGDYKVTPRSRHTGAQIEIVHDEPLPFTLLALIQEISSE